MDRILFLFWLTTAGSWAGVMSEQGKGRLGAKIKQGMEESEFPVQKVAIYQNRGNTVFEIVHCPREGEEELFLGTAVGVIDRAAGALSSTGKNALLVSCGLNDFWAVALQDLAKLRALKTAQEKGRTLREHGLVFLNQDRKALADTLAEALGKGGLAVDQAAVVHRADCLVIVLELCLPVEFDEKLGALASILEGIPALKGRVFASAEVNLNCGKEYFYHVELECLTRTGPVSDNAEKGATLKKRCHLKRIGYKM